MKRWRLLLGNLAGSLLTDETLMNAGDEAFIVRQDLQFFLGSIMLIDASILKEGLVRGLHVLIHDIILYIVVDFGRRRRTQFLCGLLIGGATLHLDTTAVAVQGVDNAVLVRSTQHLGSCHSTLHRFSLLLELWVASYAGHEHGLSDGSAEAALRLQVRVRRPRL